MTYGSSFIKRPAYKQLRDGDYDIKWIVHGQGVFLWKTDNDTKCFFCIYDAEKENGLRIQLTQKSVNVITLPAHEELTDLNNSTGLVNKDGAYYWFSLDSQNQVLSVGVGEARVETLIYKYSFKQSEKNKLFLESLVSIVLTDKATVPMKILRDPITRAVPLLIKDTHELTMDIVSEFKILPKANLSATAQQLYECIAGKKFVLDSPDFPEFSKAIEHSIATPGLWCNKRLLEKANEFSKEKPNYLETYLRITLGDNNGESPGIPYVMEIWPPNHYSPIHNHGSSHAVIRVLHGAINVSLFPFLSGGKDGAEAFAKTEFKKGDITWISPTLNQVHQLHNTDKKNTCITIQCYMYSQDNTGHYDYFDYIDADGSTKQYEPDSDMTFQVFKATMKREWEQFKAKRKCFVWF